MESLPTNVIYVVKTEYGVRHAGGTHSTRGSFFLTEKGARQARWRPNEKVWRGTVVWEEVDD